MESKVTAGFVFQKGDQIKNGSAVADIQSKTGTIVRIRPFNQISLTDLGFSDKPVTNIYLKAGGMLVRTDKLKKNDAFTISSPTTIAGVRGTLFSFDLQNGDIPRVKVFEGSVRVGINMDENEISPKDIALNPNFQKLHTFLNENEVIVESGKEASFDPTLIDLV
ncbi:MAG: FecR domain-containing protein, partial [Leptospira sp.]|nr:FecR domain-containing protein [Leptospira sp.]